MQCALWNVRLALCTRFNGLSAAALRVCQPHRLVSCCRNTGRKTSASVLFVSTPFLHCLSRWGASELCVLIICRFSGESASSVCCVCVGFV